MWAYRVCVVCEVDSTMAEKSINFGPHKTEPSCAEMPKPANPRMFHHQNNANTRGQRWRWIRLKVRAAASSDWIKNQTQYIYRDEGEHMTNGGAHKIINFRSRTRIRGAWARSRLNEMGENTKKRRRKTKINKLCHEPTREAVRVLFRASAEQQKNDFALHNLGHGIVFPLCVSVPVGLFRFRFFSAENINFHSLVPLHPLPSSSHFHVSHAIYYYFFALCIRVLVPWDRRRRCHFDSISFEKMNSCLVPSTLNCRRALLPHRRV